MGRSALETGGITSMSRCITPQMNCSFLPSRIAFPHLKVNAVAYIA
jgi:hypothetical protein